MFYQSWAPSAGTDGDQGPGYRSDGVFNLQTMQPYSINDIVRSFSKISKDMAIYLPRTSDLRQLASLATEDKMVDVVHYCMEGASKVSVLEQFGSRATLIYQQALCAYYGKLSIQGRVL